jgi:rhodanese-related sulfurtransferase
MQKSCTAGPTILLALLAGFLGGVLGPRLLPRSSEDLIADFYRTEVAVHVSPHSLRKKIGEGAKDVIIVDLRSPQEYEREHIVGAVNIAAYKDPNTPAYEDIDRIVAAFAALPKEKDVIVYCYSIPCMTGRKIGAMLAEHGIFVKHLGIGWNEWRYYWKLWNHELEWDKVKVEDYVASGKEPGAFQGEPIITPCVEGQFGC